MKTLHQHENGKESKATGPRTPLGKQRSKHNATTHGIFSRVALLASESQSEFDSLLEGLRRYFHPKELSTKS